MPDNLGAMFNNFFNDRTEDLWTRFSGKFRALVVETNDPLNMHRIRFKCPELHDYTLKPEECPWAMPIPSGGSKRCGSWVSPSIGDWVFIEFEKNHPYSPYYIGFATPTRRKMYSLPSIFSVSPTPIDAEEGVPIPVRIPIPGGYQQGTVIGSTSYKVGKQPSDFDGEYLPLDGRPMSFGDQDRYGNLILSRSIGFYPVEHDIKPPGPDFDSLMATNESIEMFQQNNQRPKANTPDSKFIANISKYGNTFVLADQGYRWDKNKDDNQTREGKLDGEFSGDFVADEDFEIDRWLYIQKLIHENKPTGRDQRRISIQTRYGHKFEMRDVGWNKTRVGEYSGDARWISVVGAKHDAESDHWGYVDDGYVDERWVKLATKGGHLLELSDVGSDPESDQFCSRLLLDEIGDQKEPSDNRYVRFMTRSGIKLLLDDRGSNSRTASDASMSNDNIGRGILIKGRRTPSSGYSDSQGDQQQDWLPENRWASAVSKKNAKAGEPTGYFWEINENVDYNHTVWGSPLGSIIEINDRDEFIAICQRLPTLPTKWQYLNNDEFVQNSALGLEFEKVTHHLMINHKNEYIRLKTRSGHGVDHDDPNGITPSTGVHQGIEMHDGPQSKAWIELADIDDRGIWFSQEHNLTVWRSKLADEMCVWMDDAANQIVIRNNTAGRVQVYCKGNIDIISGGNIAVQSGQNINIVAKNNVNIKAGSAVYNFTGAGLRTNTLIHAGGFAGPSEHVAIRGASSLSQPTISPLQTIDKNKIKPSERSVDDN